jgi:hypothetical protein
MARKQTAKIAMQLFAPPKGTMETPEQRERMATVLGMSDDPRMRRLSLDILANNNKQTSVAKLVDGLSLTWKQVETEYRSLRKSEGFIKSADHLPELMEQSALDAKSRWDGCHRCSMTGKLDGDKENGFVLKTCPDCHGEGKLYVPGEVERLKLVFDVHGLIGKNSGLNVNFDMRQISSGENLEDLADSIGPLLNGEGSIS